MKKLLGSTKRVDLLVRKLRERAMSDRSGEWFSNDMFPSDIGTKYAHEPVMIRQSRAFKAMLKAMASRSNSTITDTYSINLGELIVGTIPMGSVGLGKEFPRYLSEEERRIAFFSSRDEESMFGHNSPDYTRVLEKGLLAIIKFCDERIKYLEIDTDYHLSDISGLDKKADFYRSVKICCEAIIDFANAYADLAVEAAQKETDETRKRELNRIAQICRKVPANPAENFYEALQSIFFIHLALHSTLNLMSLGRLDQVLYPYYRESVARKELTEEEALELIECFIVKCAGRLNLTSAYLSKQDHLDYGTGLGTSPIFLDQITSANNFLQNLVIGGVDKEGKDATNDCTYLILKAYANIKLPTPTLVIRLHSKTPESLLADTATCLKNGNTGLPILYNDEVIIPAFTRSGIPIEEARDYVVDGCWEPILNAKSDWTFGMINMLTALECALNGGALLSPNNPSLLRGKKASYSTAGPSSINSFEELKNNLKAHIGYFTDKVVLGIYSFYSIDASVTPTPFFSALLGDCLTRGIDKTYGGADYILGGVIATAATNCANALVALNEYVFKQQKYSIRDVVDALKVNYDKHENMLKDFGDAPKFGNNEKEPEEMLAWLLDEFSEAVIRSKKLADDIFVNEPSPADLPRIQSMRNIMGYDGPHYKAKYGEKFSVNITAGAGTFGQYSFMGLGVAASADGRKANMPLAPNCSPASGSLKNGIGHLFSSYEKLPLNKFAAGVVVDICIDSTVQEDLLVEYVRSFVRKKCNIATISVASYSDLEAAYKACEAVRNKRENVSILNQYSHLCVRVGGWNAPFISLTEAQQNDYKERIIKQNI